MLLYLYHRRSQWDIVVLQEQRIQVSPTCFRVPDTCVVVGREPDEQVFTQPPFLCIEVLSPEDRVGRMQERISDYVTFGVAFVWLIDPQARRAWIYAIDSISEVRDGVLRTLNPAIAVPLAEIFE